MISFDCIIHSEIIQKLKAYLLIYWRFSKLYFSIAFNQPVASIHTHTHSYATRTLIYDICIKRFKTRIFYDIMWWK